MKWKLLLVIMIVKVVLNGLPSTPKAADLENHFGTETTLGIYGPKPPGIGFNLMRRGAAGGAPITPITNFHQEIFPPHVKAGQLTNTSYDAGKIIKPEMASNKNNKYRTKS